jgi:hypothetical protein
MPLNVAPVESPYHHDLLHNPGVRFCNEYRRVLAALRGFSDDGGGIERAGRKKIIMRDQAVNETV